MEICKCKTTNGLMCLAEAILRQGSIQSVECLSLTALTQVHSERQQQVGKKCKTVEFHKAGSVSKLEVVHR